MYSALLANKPQLVVITSRLSGRLFGEGVEEAVTLLL